MTFPTCRKAVVKKAENFTWSTSSQQNLFTKIKTENESATKISFQVPFLLAEQGKAYDCELIKPCLVIAVEEMGPEKTNLFKDYFFGKNNF